MYSGDSRLVILFTTSTRRRTHTDPPLPDLRHVVSNLRSANLDLSLSASLWLEDISRDSPSTSSQAQPPTTGSDFSTTGARGVPQIARCLDSYFPCLSVLATVANFLKDSDEAFFSEESYAAVLPPPVLEVELSHVLLRGLLSPSVLNFLIPMSTVLKPTFVWGCLAILANLLITFGGFIEIITEAGMYTTLYLSYLKSFHRFRLTVDSPKQSTSPSSLSSFSSEMRAVFSPASFMRNVSPPNTKWKRVSLSITVLSSCGAVRLGPEDTTDVISMIFRGADWILTSRYKVTKSQVSGAAVILALTHSSLASSSLSFYPRGFSTFSLYALLFDVVRVWLNSFLNCSSKV